MQGAGSRGGGNGVRPFSWYHLQGQGGAKIKDPGFRKLTNIRGEHKVGDGCPAAVGAGVMDLVNSSGGVRSSGAVSGAKIWHLEKSKHWGDLSCNLSVQTSAVHPVIPSGSSPPSPGLFPLTFSVPVVTPGSLFVRI